MIKFSILIVLLSHLVYTIVRGTTGIIQESNTNSNNNNNNNNNSDECGITSYYTDSTNSLIPNGEYALPGQWPWVVALTVGNEFECTGSILTNRHILTAATCFNLYVKNRFIIKVALGQFKLRHGRIVGTVNRKVASYKFHPDNDGDSGDSDLAILILKRPIEFSPFIRPICLWSNSTDLENVVDRTGYVVGWALEEYIFSQILVSEPRMLRIPIVSQETCLRSDQVYHNLTSERTFCAGLPGEIGPCYGDFGSGLVLFNNSTGHYHLRGVLSQFLDRHSFYSCNVSKYTVYVDVAKYLPWIQQQISIT